MMTARPDLSYPAAQIDDGTASLPSVRLGLAAAGRCRRRVHLDHDPDADRARQRPDDPGLQLRFDSLAAHRDALTRRLSAVVTEVMTPPAAGADASRLLVDQLCSHRPPVVISPRLVTESRFATPDVLLRDLGGGYRPVLVRGHRTTDPGHGTPVTDLDRLLAWGTSYLDPGASAGGGAPIPVRQAPRKLRAHPNDVLALAHIYRLLQELGLASSQPLGGIIGFGAPANDPGWDDGAQIIWHRLDAPVGDGTALADYDQRFADRLAVATASARRLPALARPSRIGECRRCPWWTVCGPELEAAHDVSLLTSGADVALLRDAGAATYDDVAAMAPEVIAALPLTGIPAGEARIRARAMVRGAPLIRRGDRIDPVRAQVELDVDMESFGDDGAYLWGTYLSGVTLSGFTPGYRPFATWEPLDSAATATNFVSFWRHLQSLRAACADAGLSFAAYCYSHRAEERWLFGTPERFPGQPGMPERAEVAEFCSSAQWVDLYTEMRRLFIVPGSMRLKALAPIAGFAWRDPEPGGENSMAWYRSARGDDGAAEVAANRQRILRYNEDDVIATLRLRQWISKSARQVPTAAELG